MRQANGGGGIAWGLMLALAVAGQISALSLMHAPPYAVYQHYWPWSDIADRGLLQAAIIVLELVTALLVLRRDRALVEQGVRVFARPVRVVLAATVVLFISAVPA